MAAFAHVLRCCTAHCCSVCAPVPDPPQLFHGVGEELSLSSCSELIAQEASTDDRAHLTMAEISKLLRSWFD